MILVYFTNRLNHKKIQNELGIKEAKAYEYFNDTLTQDDVVILGGTLADYSLVQTLNEKYDNKPLLITMEEDSEVDNHFRNYSFVFDKYAVKQLVKDEFKSLKKTRNLFDELTKEHQKKTSDSEIPTIWESINNSDFYSPQLYYVTYRGAEDQSTNFIIVKNSYSKLGFKYYAVYLDDFTYTIHIYSITTKYTDMTLETYDKKAYDESRGDARADRILKQRKNDDENDLVDRYGNEIEESIRTAKIDNDLIKNDDITIEPLSFEKYCLFVKYEDNETDVKVDLVKNESVSFENFKSCYLYKRYGKDIDKDRRSEFLETLYNLVMTTSLDKNISYESFSKNLSNILYSLKTNSFIQSQLAENLEPNIINTFFDYMFNFKKSEISLNNKIEWVARYFYQNRFDFKKLNNEDIHIIFRTFVYDFLDSNTFKSFYSEFSSQEIATDLNDEEQQHTIYKPVNDGNDIDSIHSVGGSHFESPSKVALNNDEVIHSLTILHTLMNLNYEETKYIYNLETIHKIALCLIYRITEEYLYKVPNENKVGASKTIKSLDTKYQVYKNVQEKQIKSELDYKKDIEDFLLLFLEDKTHIEKKITILSNTLKQFILMFQNDDFSIENIENYIKKAKDEKILKVSGRMQASNRSIIKACAPRNERYYTKNDYENEIIEKKEIGTEKTEIPFIFEQLVEAINRLKVNSKDEDAINTIKEFLSQEYTSRAGKYTSKDEAVKKIIKAFLKEL